MKHSSRWRRPLLAVLSQGLVLALSPSAAASTAYGSLNNFDCVNDTGKEAHGFEIELDGVISTDITYTYDYNHYGVPKITQDNSVPGNPKVFVRYAASRNPDGTWSAFTAIPSAPIAPTDGHQFTNPSVNFGGEHFGVGYFGTPAAVKYNWLLDDGSGNLVHGPAVYIATPTFNYVPPAPAVPAQVQAVIVPPPPPEVPVLQFGTAVWAKDIKTTTHNANKLALNELIDPDPDNPAAPNWTNGEPAEVETEWRILQTEFANPANPKGELAGVPQDLPDGNEVVTRRYEFYKYTGPLDAESGEAMADQVGPDGIHGVGSVTYNDHFDPSTGEWVTTTVDLTTVAVVGDFMGAQMAGFDVAPALGLIDHVPDGELLVAYVPRTVVVAGPAPFIAGATGSLPPGLALDDVTGVLSGTPTSSGVYTFTVNAADTTGAAVSKAYTVTIPGNVPTTGTISTSVLPVGGGTTAGDGVYQNGAQATVVATHAAGYAFLLWTDGGVKVSDSAVFPFTVNGDRTLVANFIAVYNITTTSAPALGGTTAGGGIFYSGDAVTLQATANAGYYFQNWTEGGTIVSPSTSYTFNAAASRTLVANFARITFQIGTAAYPLGSGTVAGGGQVFSGDTVALVASPNAGFHFVNWTESGTVVSTAASYSFTATGNRSLVANFAVNVPVLGISAVTALRTQSKAEVSVTVFNSGWATAQAVTIDARKAATLDGKAANEHPPIILGDIAPAATATATLTFTGTKPGTKTLLLALTYQGGATTLSTAVTVP